MTASLEGSTESVVVNYEHEDAFLHLLRHAELDDTIVSRLEDMVTIAFISPRIATHFEDIELTNGQLGLLRLSAALRLIA